MYLLGVTSNRWKRRRRVYHNANREVIASKRNENERVDGSIIRITSVGTVLMPCTAALREDSTDD